MIKQLTLALLVSSTTAAPSVTDLKSMLSMKWNADAVDKSKAIDEKIIGDVTKLAEETDWFMGLDHVQKSQQALEAKFDALGKTLDGPMKDWMNTEDFKNMSATGAEFFKTKIDTPANRRMNATADRFNNRLVRNIKTNLDDFDMSEDGTPVWIKVKNNDIINVTKKEIQQRKAVEIIVNSDEGQDMLRSVGETMTNKEAGVVAQTVQSGVDDIMTSSKDPLGQKAFEKHFQERAQVIGQSIDEQIRLLTQTIEVGDTKDLESQKNQRLWRMAGRQPRFKNPWDGPRNE